MSSEKQPEYLAHHGVKGMKWGVRKSRPSSGGSRRPKSSTAKTPSSRSGAGATAAKKRRIRALAVSIKQRFRSGETNQNGSKAKTTAPQKPSVKDMSDEELTRRINRMEKERRYRDLQTQLNPQKPSFGKKMLDDAIKPALIQASRTTLTSMLTKTGEKYVKELFPDDKTPLEKLQKRNQLLGAKKKNIELDAWLNEYNRTGEIPKKEKKKKKDDD